MKLNPQDLHNVAELTLEHYNQRAEDFWEGPMRVIALIEDAEVIRRILEHLGLWVPQVKDRGPPLDFASTPPYVSLPLTYHTVPTSPDLPLKNPFETAGVREKACRSM